MSLVGRNKSHHLSSPEKMLIHSDWEEERLQRLTDLGLGYMLFSFQMQMILGAYKTKSVLNASL